MKQIRWHVEFKHPDDNVYKIDNHHGFGSLEKAETFLNRRGGWGLDYRIVKIERTILKTKKAVPEEAFSYEGEIH